MKRRLYYNRTNTCDRCKDRLITGKARREYDRNGNWTGNWLCGKCWEKFDPNSHNNIIKTLCHSRVGSLDFNSNKAKGDRFQELTCRWRKVKDLNIENDNFMNPIDHSRDPELGVLQTKGVLYNSIEGRWHQNLVQEHNKQFDNLIFYCADETGENIIRIYVIPRHEVIKMTSITINPSKDMWHRWHDSYRVNQETCNYVNDIFQKIVKASIRVN